MKIIVTHTSPDWDAITSIWFLKKFLPGWENASIKFVPAGQTLRSPVMNYIENIGGDEVIHVDTGMGPLDHHQISDKNISAASLCWDYVKKENNEFAIKTEKIQDRISAINRLVKIIVDTDHFKEVFWENPSADYHEFSLLGLLEGIKMQKPNQDEYYVFFGMECLDAELHNFENRVWAEKELKKGKEFTTRFGKGLAFETLNDTVMKLSQKMGYVIVIRKDPRKGYVRIKARPDKLVILEGNSPIGSHNSSKKQRDAIASTGTVLHPSSLQHDKGEIDLTLVYEKLKKMDPNATWFLHISKKMLLNGTPKNPKMIPTTLSLEQIVKVVENI